MLHNINMSYFIWPWLINIVTIISVLLALLLISHISRSPRPPVTTMGWLFVILFIPLIGIPLYLSFGVRKLNIKIKKTRIELPTTSEIHPHPIHSLLVSLGISGASSGNIVHFHDNGKVAYQELITLLVEAQQTIDISLFILDDDNIGREVLTLLENKAMQGVQVRLLLDGVGSFKLSKRALKPLAKHGGQIAWFIPVLHRPLRGRTNLRNHRKIIITDQNKVWTGGRNIASNYLGVNCPKDCWVDLTFCLEGSAVSTYYAIFEADWHFATNTANEYIRNETQAIKSGESRVQVIPSGPDVAEDPLYATILTACYEAHRRIIIVTAYYVPDTGVQEALRLAALRGVTVDLILPEKSNHSFADIARNHYLHRLASAGVRIWFLPDNMVHAKALVIDNSFAMAGSANIDTRSLFLNCELMNGFYSEKDINWLINWMTSLQNQCYRYYPQKAGVFKGILEGLVLLFAYQL